MQTRTRAAVTALSMMVALAGSTVAAASAQAAPRYGCYVTAKAAKIRAKPTTHSTALGIAYKNQTCTEKGRNGRWNKVKMKRSGVTGWIRGDLVHTSDDDVSTCIPEYCP
ncbi:hypothetical protein ACI2L4_09940 [Streptomyces sparsogenes]|uniref:hypothetical protein n=1 Tax=Streptomyces sparsogenes TaxID=67365 RepID=UPI00384F2BB9